MSDSNLIIISEMFKAFGYEAVDLGAGEAWVREVEILGETYSVEISQANEDPDAPSREWQECNSYWTTDEGCNVTTIFLPSGWFGPLETLAATERFVESKIMEKYNDK